MAYHNPTQQGFSLTELMIVVAIVAILAAIGLPSYRNYAMQAKRADAHNAITTIANLQERYFTENNSYTSDLAAVGYADLPIPPVPVLTDSSPDGYWQVTISASTATSYTIRAVPSATHTDPNCAQIEQNSLGAKSPTTCW